MLQHPKAILGPLVSGTQKVTSVKAPHTDCVLNMRTSCSSHDMSWFHLLDQTSQYIKRKSVCVFSTHMNAHRPYSIWVPWVWTGLIYTPYADRGLCMTILCVHRATDWHTASRALFLMSSAVLMTMLKALEGRWGVSYSGDHYQQLLYIDAVTASSICPSDLLMFCLCFLFSVLFICIHREILEDIRAPVTWWEIESTELASNVIHLIQSAFDSLLKLLWWQSYRYTGIWVRLSYYQAH